MTPFSQVSKIKRLWWLNSPFSSYFMSIRWVTKMAATLPLNLQEERVVERLQSAREEYRTHEVFPLGKRAVIVDFYLPKHDTVIECWRSDSRRGVALTWMEKNAAYVDLKFRRLKEKNPRLRCFAFVEAPQVDGVSLEEVVGAVLVHADSVAYSMDEFVEALRHV